MNDKMARDIEIAKSQRRCRERLNAKKIKWMIIAVMLMILCVMEMFYIFEQSESISDLKRSLTEIDEARIQAELRMKEAQTNYNILLYEGVNGE